MSLAAEIKFHLKQLTFCLQMPPLPSVTVLFPAVLWLLLVSMHRQLLGLAGDAAKVLPHTVLLDPTPHSIHAPHQRDRASKTRKSSRE